MVMVLSGFIYMLNCVNGGVMRDDWCLMLNGVVRFMVVDGVL